MARTATATRKPARRSSGRPSVQAQHDKIAALRERFDEWESEMDEDQLADLLTRVQGYSDHNALLIVMQCPDVTEVHGYGQWKTLGRSVRKGEHGIQILAPAGHADDTEPTPEQPEGKSGRRFFRLAYVFDVAQTEPLGTDAS